MGLGGGGAVQWGVGRGSRVAMGGGVVGGCRCGDGGACVV